MNDATVALIVALLAYLAGSIPFGYLIPKWTKGIDIREHGSGNPGATNVLRTLGNGWGFLVLGLDLLKGLLPTWLLPLWLLPPESESLTHMQVLAGVCAVLGHTLPIFLKFRGGKGVATALGVIIVLGGWGTLIAVVVFFGTFAIWRLVSFSSMSAACSFGIAQLVLLYPYPSTTWSLLAFSLAVPALIVYRHRSNIVRLWNREEQRTEFSRHTEPTSEEAP